MSNCSRGGGGGREPQVVEWNESAPCLEREEQGFTLHVLETRESFHVIHQSLARENRKLPASHQSRTICFFWASSRHCPQSHFVLHSLDRSPNPKPKALAALWASTTPIKRRPGIGGSEVSLRSLAVPRDHFRSFRVLPGRFAANAGKKKKKKKEKRK